MGFILCCYEMLQDAAILKVLGNCLWTFWWFMSQILIEEYLRSKSPLLLRLQFSLISFHPGRCSSLGQLEIVPVELRWKNSINEQKFSKNVSMNFAVTLISMRCGNVLVLIGIFRWLSTKLMNVGIANIYTHMNHLLMASKLVLSMHVTSLIQFFSLEKNLHRLTSVNPNQN